MEGSKLEMYFLDTHVLIWLYQGDIEVFPEQIREILEKQDTYTSPIVKLELQYLYEVKRATVPATKVLNYLYQAIGLNVRDISFDALANQALDEFWTRDPFDRFITAHAKLEKGFLITKDAIIHKHYKRCLWE